jgi:hypothetical protein
MVFRSSQEGRWAGCTSSAWRIFRPIARGDPATGRTRAASRGRCPSRGSCSLGVRPRHRTAAPTHAPRPPARHVDEDLRKQVLSRARGGRSVHGRVHRIEIGVAGYACATSSKMDLGSGGHLRLRPCGGRLGVRRPGIPEAGPLGGGRLGGRCLLREFQAELGERGGVAGWPGCARSRRATPSLASSMKPSETYCSTSSRTSAGGCALPGRGRLQGKGGGSDGSSSISSGASEYAGGGDADAAGKATIVRVGGSSDARSMSSSSACYSEAEVPQAFRYSPKATAKSYAVW